MRNVIATLLLLLASVNSQDVVEVECGQDAITAKIQKEVVTSSGYEKEDIHLNDNSCLFDGEDGEFFVSVISPLTACETYFTVNETHVQFTNTISSMETGKTYPLGVVVGPQKTANVLSAFISCTYRIDLRVSTLFFPNITVIPIRVPKTFGDGEFKVAMSLYTDATYRTPYIDPPTLQADEVLFVGVNIVNEASPDVYLLIEKCWGTTTDDADGIPSYPLIDDGCPIANKGNNEIKITQNGISHQSLWRAPVFKFVGGDEDYSAVWLHCDLQICINRECQPSCARRRKRRNALNRNSDMYYGPSDFQTPNIISIGPLRRLLQPITNDTVNLLILEQPKPEVIYPQEYPSKAGDNTMTVAIVVGVLGALALVSIILALFLLLIKIRNRPNNSGFNMTGKENQAYAT